MAYSSQEEGEPLSDDPDCLAEQFGTPPLRHNPSQSRLDKLAGPRKLRKLPSHTELPRKDKQGRRSRQMTKHERQKERLDARAFKELDTTLQVLGIDGSTDSASSLRVTASPHAPILPSRPGKQRGTPKGSDTLEHSFSSKLSLESSSSIASDGRSKSRGPQALSRQRRSGSFPALSRVSSQLEDERQRWHEGLDNLLQGKLDQDDLQVAISLASGKANDLKEQLIYWQTPPEPTWRAREERIEWLFQALIQLKDVMTGLQQHGISWTDSEHVRLYMKVMKEVVVELENMASMCCDAIVDGLQSLKEAPHDMRQAFRAAYRFITMIQSSSEKQRKMQDSHAMAGWATYVAHSGEICSRVIRAMMEATADLQDTLLVSTALTVNLGTEFSGHEVSDRCKQLQLTWHQCAEIAATVAKSWPGQANAVYCAWCKLMVEAARLANEMQQSLLESERQSSCLLSSGSSNLDDGGSSYVGTTGVWGALNVGSASREMGRAVTDEELQAQAWLPACLTRLLSNAENAATAALGCGEEIHREGQDCGEGKEEWRACHGQVELLSDALYELALTSTRRVGSMCLQPSGLACWALELLEEQACQAVVFVRDLDRSVLGRGEHGLVHYETLRKATDTLVNSILRVRRLLKQKRAADSEEGLPRPLPIIRSDSRSSLTTALKQSVTKSPQQPPTNKVQRNGATGARSSKAAKAPASGRPPLANGSADAASQQDEISQPRNIPGCPYATSSDSRAQTGEEPPIALRRSKSRHHHGSATPPIPEDSDGEAGRYQAVELPSTNGLDYRDERSERFRHQGRRHRHRKHRHPRQQEPSLEADTAPQEAAEAGMSNGVFEMDANGPASSDPFAQAAVQLQPFQSQPGASLPLAVFSSGGNTSGSSNTLVPAGSSTQFRFGSFSTSPTQAGGVPSPRHRLTEPRGGVVSPFAGALAPKSSQGSARSTSQNSSSGAPEMPATPKLEARQPIAGMPSVDTAGPSMHAWRTPYSEWNGHPKSDPTNGYLHLQHMPSLARVSGEPLKRQGSDDSSGDSVGRNDTFSGQNSRPSESEGRDSTATVCTSEDVAEAFKLPWADDPDPFWQIKWEELKPTLIRKIGSGSFGQVYEAYYHCAPMAVKIINIDGDATALPGALIRFKQEVDLQRRLSLFPSIVRFLGACCHIPDAPPGNSSAYTTSNVTLAIVMELCRFGTLFKVIEWARKVSKLSPEVLAGTATVLTPEEQKLKATPGFRLYSSWQLRVDLAKHAASAVEYMHANNIIHRDLTSYNLLVTDKFEAKVADFNLSRAMKGEMIPSSGVINSPEWAAPERLSGQARYNGRAADVFSFGVILWELITLAWPWHPPETDFSGLSEGDVPEGVPGAENGVPEPDRIQQPQVPLFMVMQNVTQGVRLEFPPLQDIQPPLPQLPKLIDLAKACWKQNPVERPTMTEVCRKLDVILESIKQQARERKRSRQPIK